MSLISRIDNRSKGDLITAYKAISGFVITRKPEIYWFILNLNRLTAFEIYVRNLTVLCDNRELNQFFVLFTLQCAQKYA